MHYLLTLANESMPDATMIVVTEKNPVAYIRSLDNLSIPLPFRCVYAVESDTPTPLYDLEKAIPGIFPDTKIRENRNFYGFNPNVIKRLLNLLVSQKLVREIDIDNEEITNSVEDVEALEKQERRTKFRFSMVGIQPDSILTFSKDKSITAKVINDTEIEYEGVKTTTSLAARKALEKVGKPSKYGVQGPLYWEYKDKTLAEWRYDKEEFMSKMKEIA